MNDFIQEQGPVYYKGNVDLFINQRGGPGRSPANPAFGNPAKPDFRFDQCFQRLYEVKDNERKYRKQEDKT